MSEKTNDPSEKIPQEHLGEDRNLFEDAGAQEADPPGASDELIVVGIGASAGGLEALKAALPGFPVGANMCFVVAQHLDPKHRSMMASLLDRHTTMPVFEATDGQTIEPDTIYITPPGKDVTLSGDRLILSNPLASIGPKPSVDYFLTSLAETKGDRAVGIILSGTGSDGAHGIRAIKAGGGITIVQDENTAKYNGMPHSAIQTGHVDMILPPENIGQELMIVIKYPHLIPKSSAEDEAPADIHRILDMIKERAGADFSDYKLTTINRRIGRRMALQKIASIDHYVRALENDPKELDLLFKDILISVTSFFRDPEAFNALYDVLPKLLESKSMGDDIRVWVPGCATGEEAYTIAIILTEILGAGISRYNIQIFGTDLDQDAIVRARRGTYAKTTLVDMEKSLVEKYFIQEDNTVQVVKSIREMIVFAKQDITKDPPFSHLDLVSCRNLLIYFNTALQKKILPMFHFILNAGGILFLGKSETIGQFADLFEPAVKKWKIYRRRDAIRAPAADFVFRRRAGCPANVPVKAGGGKKEFSIKRVFGEAVMDAYEHCGVLIDDRQEVVYVHGDVSPYLTLAPGEVGLNIINMARAPLRMELRAIIHKSLREDKMICSKKIRTEAGTGEHCLVRLRIAPARSKGGPSYLAMVVFERMKPDKDEQLPSPDGKSEDPRVAELEHDLAAAREHLQTTVEELETANEELQSLNEELQSANEELQSSNEELETSNEELQSTNEELTTVNEELQVKSGELATANVDLENVLKSVGIALVIVDNKLRVTRFTLPAGELFEISSAEIGQLITTIPAKVVMPNFHEFLARAADRGEKSDRDFEAGGKSYRMRVLSYVDEGGCPAGAMIVFFDMTRLKRTEKVLRKSEERSSELEEANRRLAREIAERKSAERRLLETNGLLESAFTNIHVMIAYMDAGFRFVRVNRRYAEAFGLDPEFFTGRGYFELWPDREIGEIFDRVMKTGESHFIFARLWDGEREKPASGPRFWDWTMLPIKDSSGKTSGLLLSITDVTERERELGSKG